MKIENAYSILGFAHAFQELNENNTVEISEATYGNGWDELAEALEDLLRGMKCDVRAEKNDDTVTIIVAE